MLHLAQERYALSRLIAWSRISADPAAMHTSHETQQQPQHLPDAAVLLASLGTLRQCLLSPQGKQIVATEQLTFDLLAAVCAVLRYKAPLKRSRFRRALMNQEHHNRSPVTAQLLREAAGCLFALQGSAEGRSIVSKVH